VKKITHCMVALSLLVLLAGYSQAAAPAQSTASQTQDETLLRPRRATEIKGMAIRNSQGQSLGKIDELVIGTDGTITYAIMSHGGFLGIGDKLIPIPWKAVKQGKDDNSLIVNIARETLEKAPSFDPKEWPNFTEPDWRKRIEVHYELPQPVRE